MSLVRSLRPLVSNSFRRLGLSAPLTFIQAASFATTSKDSDADFQPKVSSTVDQSYEEVKSKISNLVKSNPVVLFMKGSPDSPQCGFSRAVVKILAAEEVDDYVYADVLKSPSLREGVKKFSDWPTIPQVYVKGEFVGGCDILTEMHKSGELKKLLTERGVVAK
jgi:monothiol glutaredoxin